MARKIPDALGQPALHSGDTATAVRWTLQRLGELAPGHSVEVRVPPFGAVQCIAGIHHRRGTPPNVVEMSPDTWLSLVRGQSTFAQAVADGAISESGAFNRAELTALISTLTTPVIPAQ